MKKHEAEIRVNGIPKPRKSSAATLAAAIDRYWTCRALVPPQELV